MTRSAAYSILDVPEGATTELIASSYRTLIKVWHPDRFAADPRTREVAEEKLNQINIAFEVVTGKRPPETDEQTRPDQPKSKGDQERPASPDASAPQTNEKTSSKKPWWKTLSRYQWLVLLIAWLGWVFDIMDTALFNFAKTPMLKELFHGPQSQQPLIDGAFLTLLLIGWSVGGLVFGILADRWGRVRTLTLTVLIYCIFTGATSLCHTWQQVAFIRFITALGIGGEWAAGAALVAEAFPDKARAPGAAILQSAAAFGPWFAALINLAIPAHNWRYLFLIGVAPALITVFLRLGVQEPEKWKTGKSPRRSSLLGPLEAMFSHPIWRKHAVLALLLGVSGIAAANNISYWLPNLTKAVSDGLSVDEAQRRVSYVTLTMHVGTLLGVFAMPWLCERVGRKKALATFFVVSPLSVAAATLGGNSFDRLLLLAPVMSFFTIGMSAGFVLYFPELFPTAFRATGAGFAYNTGRIVAAGIPILTGLVIGSSKSIAFGVALAALVPVIGLGALIFAPETRGKPLPS